MYLPIERSLHTAFSPNRVNERREFFDIEPYQAIAIPRMVARKDVTPPVTVEINKSVSDIEKAAPEQYKKRRRPNLNFIEMGIPIGAR